MRSTLLGRERPMTDYEIRIQSPDGSRGMTWKLQQTDDMSALTSALEACENQKIGVGRPSPDRLHFAFGPAAPHAVRLMVVIS